MTTTQKRNDPIAFYAVLALVGLAFFANFYHADVPAEAQGIIVLEATATPSLPTPALAAPVIDLALPTPIPPALPAPAWPADVATTPTQEVIYVYIKADTDTHSPDATEVDPAMQYGSPEFNAVLTDAYKDLPVLNCPCGPDQTPNAPTARDYAYSRARTR